MCLNSVSPCLTVIRRCLHPILMRIVSVYGHWNVVAAAVVAVVVAADVAVVAAVVGGVRWRIRSH